LNGDQLLRRLAELSAKATPGPWKSAVPVRVKFAGMEGPLMSYLYGNSHATEGMKVSLGSERVADHQFVAELVNAWREGRLCVVDGEYVPPSRPPAAGDES